MTDDEIFNLVWDTYLEVNKDYLEEQMEICRKQIEMLDKQPLMW